MHVHPYYIAKARAAFRKRQGDPEATSALAQWASQARPNTGVIIAEDGEILAETARQHGGEVSPYYVTQVMVEDTGAHHVDSVADVAANRLSRTTGKATIHIASSEVSHGPSPEWIS